MRNSLSIGLRWTASLCALLMQSKETHKEQCSKAESDSIGPSLDQAIHNNDR
jgi:hypothetical protein